MDVAQQTRSVDADLLIVGAGILGLAHAAEAARADLRVIVVDRDDHAVGASVRNFGHCCITAQTGDLLDLALASRERWLEYAASAGLWSSESGALAVARTEAELAVLDELATERGRDGVRMVTAAECTELLGGSRGGAADDRGILGGAMLAADIRVDPRTAVAGIAAWLADDRGVDIRWSTAYLGETDGVARTSRGEIRAARTLICVGHDLDLLHPDVAAAHEVLRCSLQMALVDPGPGVRFSPAVLTGTSMLRYPAFASTWAADDVRADVLRSDPALLDIQANVMMTQRSDGTVIVGDSHAYARTPDPFLDEAVADLLLHRTLDVIGARGARVRQRWQGVYASGRDPFLVEPVSDRVTAVSVTSGVGMTLSFGLARRVVSDLV